jgi:hypothetical protein
MKRRSPFASAVAASIVASSMPASGTPVHAARVKTAKAACDLVKARVSAARHFATSEIAFCDVIPAASTPKAFYVLALHSKRNCDGICSRNMGWFAVQKTTGHVFEWDMAEEKLGRPVTPHR